MLLRGGTLAPPPLSWLGFSCRIGISSPQTLTYSIHNGRGGRASQHGECPLDLEVSELQLTLRRRGYEAVCMTSLRLSLYCTPALPAFPCINNDLHDFVLRMVPLGCQRAIIVLHRSVLILRIRICNHLLERSTLVAAAYKDSTLAFLQCTEDTLAILSFLYPTEDLLCSPVTATFPSLY